MSHNTSSPSTSSVTLSISSLVSLAIEHWRLSTWLEQIDSPAAAPARHAVQKIGDLLARCEVEARSLNGLPFDAGLSAQVIDVVEDFDLPPGQTLIDETLAPLVLWRGQVVESAQVITRQAPK